MVIVAIFVSVAAAVPLVVVVVPASRTLPMAREVVPANVVGLDPIRAPVGRPRPVPVVPAVVIALRIPVTFNPDKFRRGLRLHDVVTRRRWRSADADVEGHLSLCR